MQRRWSFPGARWLLSLVAGLILMGPVRGESGATVIEESFGTWYQWPASEGGNDHWYGVIRLMMEPGASEQFARAWATKGSPGKVRLWSRFILGGLLFVMARWWVIYYSYNVTSLTHSSCKMINDMI